MQMEDVMFIDHHTMVSLEYIFYQGDGNYKQLNQTALGQCKSHLIIEPVKNNGTHFNQGPISFQCEQDFLSDHISQS